MPHDWLLRTFSARLTPRWPVTLRKGGTSSMLKRNRLAILGALAVFGLEFSVEPFAFAGPQFSRQYNTSCNTCHTVYPKLNDFGKVFLDAGFQFPEEDLSLIEQPQALLAMSVSAPQ